MFVGTVDDGTHCKKDSGVCVLGVCKSMPKYIAPLPPSPTDSSGKKIFLAPLMIILVNNLQGRDLEYTGNLPLKSDQLPMIYCLYVRAFILPLLRKALRWKRRSIPSSS